MKNNVVGLSDQKLSREEMQVFLAAEGEFGAQNIFVGIVRDNNQNRKVKSIFFDHHPQICGLVMEEIVSEVKKKIVSECRIYFLHRVGSVYCGEDCILIGVATKHRDEAFRSCRYIIEETKKRLPIWKKEVLADDTAVWLDGISLNGGK